MALFSRKEAKHRVIVARYFSTMAPGDSEGNSRSGSSSNGVSNHGARPSLMKRSVVSSFIYKFSPENGQRKPKIALFRRSGKVRTYP